MSTRPPASGLVTVWLIAAAGIAGSVAIAYLLSVTARHAGVPAETARTASPAASDLGQVFDLVKDRASDPDLAASYDDLNVQYFDDRLPRDVAILWDDRLEDIGPRLAEGFRLEGLTNGRIILINPSIQRVRAELRRTICHEMVHVQVWSRDRAHGAIFQQALRAIWERAAFTGLLATEEDKQEMRRKLRTLSARIAIEEGDRTAAGVARTNASIVEYNRLAEQYNLMIAYPDGLDGERAARR